MGEAKRRAKEIERLKSLDKDAMATEVMALVPRNGAVTFLRNNGHAV